MKRIPELDGLRGLLALVVVGFHLIPGHVPLGWIGVDGFFVLSGYLISSILIANRATPGYFRNFYGRRVLRIWPIYYLSLLWVVVSYQIFPTKYPIDRVLIAQYAAYIQGIQQLWGGTERTIKAFSHTWTLAIEEQFYILWPLIIRLVSKRSLVLLCVMLAAMSVGLRMGGLDGTMLPARCDGFSLGTIVAVVAAEASPATVRVGLLRGLLLAAMAIGGAGVAITALASAPLMVRFGLSRGMSSALLILAANLSFAGLIG